MGNYSEFARLDYPTVVMAYAQSVSLQLLKLPHEVIDQNLSTAVGQTYVQIIQSYCDAVTQFEKLLQPYLGKDYYSEVAKLDKDENLKVAQEKFGLLMVQCDEKGLLLQCTKTSDLEADDNE